VILWDVDGTLLDFKAAEKAAVKKCFRIFGLGECTDVMVAEYSHINTEYWKKLELGLMTKPQILVGRFKEFFSLHGLDVSVCERFNDEYQVRLGETVVFFEGARETLAALSGVCLQCAVTNGTKIAQDIKLRNSGLDKVFDRIFISEIVGFEKPNVGFFDAVFSALSSVGHFEKDEIMIVGDSLTSDMKGGAAAGIRTCFFNPLRLPHAADIRIDCEIARIPEVLSLPGIPAAAKGAEK
jgi:2-haloacid dehalogenase